jgi:sulfate transport system ATP-binding protein
VITVSNLSKVFGGYAALRNVSLEVASGELVALLGPSGSGKTTLLRIIAGLEQPSEGAVYFNGSDATALRTGERKVGFVFQHYALFRHMTVAQNVAFGLEVRKRPHRPAKAEIDAKVAELLRLVQLEAMAHRYPSQLSGGQRQRVALARALAIEPQVLLLDEPFGALDAQVRKELRRWLRRLHDDIGITSVFVTHDQEEALEVADRIVVMNQGGIEQVGSPTEIYDHPVSPFVYRFLGNVNALPVQVENGAVRVAGLPLGAAHAGTSDGEGVAFVRPHDVELLPVSQGDGIEVGIDHVTVLGPVVRVELSLAGGLLIEAETTRQAHRDLGLAVGGRVRLRPRQARLFLHDGWQGTNLAP